jgi:hypothetical protein
MLVFVDESGDLGFKFKRGSSPFFSIALVVFESGEAALACQRAIEGLQKTLNLPARYEFKFHDDSHRRRLQLLSTVAKYDFVCYTFTLDKGSPRLTREGFKHKESAYKWVCKTALDNAKPLLRDATVIIDGSGDRTFRRQMRSYLRGQINTKRRRYIGSVKIGRSPGDPLLQLADYAAGVTNRLYRGKTGAEAYDQYLRLKRRSQRIWP